MIRKSKMLAGKPDPQRARVQRRKQAQEKYYELLDDEVLGKHITTLVDAESSRKIRNSMMERGMFSGELEVEIKDGLRHDIDLSIFPILNEAGKPVHFVGMGRDITEIKQALADLEEANRNLKETQWRGSRTKSTRPSVQSAACTARWSAPSKNCRRP